MPYIYDEARQDLEFKREPENVGELTYVIQRSIAHYLLAKRADGADLHYADFAEVLGALEGARVDFERRVLAPYEERKLAEHGDVWDRAIIEAR